MNQKTKEFAKDAKEMTILIISIAVGIALVTYLLYIAENAWGRSITFLLGVLIGGVYWLLWHIYKELQLISKQIFNIAIKRNNFTGSFILGLSITAHRELDWRK